MDYSPNTRVVRSRNQTTPSLSPRSMRAVIRLPSIRLRFGNSRSGARNENFRQSLAQAHTWTLRPRWDWEIRIRRGLKFATSVGEGNPQVRLEIVLSYDPFSAASAPGAGR